MERILVFDAQVNWTCAAVIENGFLVEFHTERFREKEPTESLYLGRVKQIRPSLNAAFVDIGEEQNAFLPIEDNDPIRCGDLIVVQGAAKQSVDSKGLRITRRINLAGKGIVLIPGENSIHISKKIKDDIVRAELMKLGESILPNGFGMIIRTVSTDVTEEFLCEEVKHLVHCWNNVQDKAHASRTPGILWARPSLDERLVRDLGGSELLRIVTNNQRQLEHLQEWKQQGMILPHVKLELHKEENDLIFDVFRIMPQLDKSLKHRVWLPCGGYLVFDSCEAMTVIDVNSGKMTLGRNVDETALCVNLEAVEEIARQIRLRNIGGIIMADFIDMAISDNRETIARSLRQAVSTDRIQVDVLGFTKLGLMEMSRKRTSDELRKKMRISCSSCSGTGEMPSAEDSAIRILQQIRRMAASGQTGPFLVKCASAVSDFLSGMINPLDAGDIFVLSSGRHTGKYDIEQTSSAMPQGAVALRKRKET